MNSSDDAGKPVVPLNFKLCAPGKGSLRLFDFGLVSIQTARLFKTDGSLDAHGWINRLNFGRSDTTKRVATVIDLPWEQRDETQFDRARATPGRVMLAGGLGPANVRAAIDAVHPWAVDSARSTEQAPGIKDHKAIRDWVEAAR